jgi:hypothetical protein
MIRQRILNNRAQPVELHLTTGVVVIPPLGEAEIDADEAGERHLEHLAAELRVTILAAAPETADAAAEEESLSEVSEPKTKKKTAAKRPR